MESNIVLQLRALLTYVENDPKAKTMLDIEDAKVFCNVLQNFNIGLVSSFEDLGSGEMGQLVLENAVAFQSWVNAFEELPGVTVMHAKGKIVSGNQIWGNFYDGHKQLSFALFPLDKGKFNFSTKGTWLEIYHVVRKIALDHLGVPKFKTDPVAEAYSSSAS